jgi:hypothetical protein
MPDLLERKLAQKPEPSIKTGGGDILSRKLAGRDLLSRKLSGQPAGPTGVTDTGIVSTPLSDQQIAEEEALEKRHSQSLAYQKLSPEGKYLHDKGYPQEWISLMKKAPDRIAVQPLDELGLYKHTTSYKRTPEETFQYNYGQLSKDDPLRQQVDEYQAVLKAYTDNLVKEGIIEGPRKFKGFWNELGRSLAAGSLNVASGITGTLSTASESAIWDKEALEEIAKKLHEKAKSKPFAPSRAEGKWNKTKQFTAQAIGNAFPYMAASTAATIATGTPLAAFGVGYAVEGDNEYRDIIAAGGSEEAAQMGRLIVGTINGAIESLQVSNIIRFAKEGKSGIKTIINAAKQKAWAEVKKAGKSLTQQQLQHVLREAMEEALQETASITGVNVAVPGTVGLKEGVKRVGSSAAGGGIVGGIFGGGGALLTRGQQKTEGGEFETLEEDLTKKIMDRADVDEPTARAAAKAAIEEKYYEDRSQLPAGSVLAAEFGDKQKIREERQRLSDKQEAEAAAMDAEVTGIQRQAMREGISQAAAEQAETKQPPASRETREGQITRPEKAAAEKKAAKPLTEQALTEKQEKYTTGEKPAVEGEKGGKIKVIRKTNVTTPGVGQTAGNYTAGSYAGDGLESQVTELKEPSTGIRFWVREAVRPPGGMYQVNSGLRQGLKAGRKVPKDWVQVLELAVEKESQVEWDRLAAIVKENDALNRQVVQNKRWTAKTAKEALKKAKSVEKEKKRPWEMTKEEYEKGKFAYEGGGEPGVPVPEYPKIAMKYKGKVYSYKDGEKANGIEIHNHGDIYNAIVPEDEDAEFSIIPGWIDKKGNFVATEPHHEAEVRQAVEFGKPVPLSVLQEYKGEKWAEEAISKLKPAAVAGKVAELQAAIDELQESRITRTGKSTYNVTYSTGISEEKTLTPGEARKIRNKINRANQLYEEKAGGLSRARRNQHIRDVEERIKKNDLYQTQVEADEIRGGQIGTGFYYVGKHMKGEMEHALEGEPAELRKMFTTDPHAGASNWDVAVQEALLTETEDEQYDTSGYMDVEEFIDRVKEAYYNQKGIRRGISGRALQRAEQMQAGTEYRDAEFEMLIEKRRMLKAGEGAAAIDDMIRNWADNYGIDEDLIAAEFVGAEPLKLKQIKQITDADEQDRQLDLLAEQQILEEERQEARKAVKEVLAENKIEVEVKTVRDIPRATETKRDLLGTPFNEGYRGKTKGFGFELTEAEAKTAIKPELEQAIISELNKQKAPTTWQQMLAKIKEGKNWAELFYNYMKPEAEMKSAWATAIKGEELGLAFEGQTKATGAAVVTEGGREIVLLAYGADSATGYHEGYHILRRRLTKTDIRVLEMKFEDEEAEAAAFGRYAAGDKTAAKTPMVRAIWNKLVKILERIKNALMGRGYVTAEDIFGGLAEGTRAMEARPLRGFGTKAELTNEQARREVNRRAIINARKAKLKERAGLSKKGPKIKRIKIKIDETATPYLKEDLKPDTPLPAAKAIEFKKTGGVKNQRLGRKFYEESIKKQSFREARRDFREKMGSEASRVWAGIEKVFSASSTRLNNISPELFRRVRKYVYNVMTRSTAMMADMEPFLKATKKMSGADQKTLDLAFKNGDDRQIGKLIAKYKLTDQYAATRDVLNEIFEAAKEVGMDIEYRKDYWHRSLKDPVGFLEYFQKGDDWSIIKEAIKRRAKRAGRTIEELTPAEKAQVVNTLLRGYRTQALALATPGAAKERTVELIDRNINKFYHDFRTSIVEYIRMMNGKIAEREFFGRETKEIVQLRKTQSARLTRLIKLKRRQGLKAGATEPQYTEHISTTMENWQAGQERLYRLQNRPLEDTIGGLIERMVASDDIRPSQEKQLRDILKGIFDPKRMGSKMGLVATGMYIDTLNSPLQAITQLEEFGLAFYRSPVRFIPATVRSLLRRSKITPRDIGITSIGEEFYGASMKKALAVQLKAIAFEQIDRLGKETYINTVLSKYQAAAKKGKTKPWLYKRLAKVFGAQYKQVLEDLRNGNISDNVKYLLFNELLDIQPVALSEMPEAYNKAGNMRILYTLKTFLIRRMDFIRNECIKDMKSKKTFMRGFGKLIWLAFSLGLFGAGADALKDFIRGKDFDLADSVVDNLLRLAMFSKYQAWRTTEKGFGTAVTEGWRPPTKAVDAATRDIINAAKGKDRGFELWRSVPVVGEVYYWWFGEGRRKLERKRGNTRGTGKKKARRNIFD